MGRSSIFLIIGFTTIFLMAGRNLSSISMRALTTSISYYENTTGHNIAEAGANFGCNAIFLTPNWRTGYSNVPFAGGMFTVTASSISGSNNVLLVSTATYGDKTYEMKITLQPSGFQKFGFWGGTGASAAAWETGDTVTGPMHVQGTLKTYGQPVFQGKVTTQTGLTKYGSPATPQFNGGYETGVSIPLPTATFPKLDSIASNGGYKRVGTDMYLTFNADGTVTWKTSPGGTDTTVALTTLAPNGVLEVDKGNIYVQGTVKGKLTIVANKTTGTTGGKVYVQNNLVYATDPRVDPESEDMLGIVSKGDVTIQDNGATTFNVMASMYVEAGGMAVQNGTSRPAGVLNVVGGLIVQNLYGTSNGASGSDRRGYNLSLQYDQRYRTSSPPSYPATGSYEILSWLE